jgi:hypothetical protein
MPLLTTRGLGRAGNSGPTMDFVSITPNNLALAILFTDQVELVGAAANYANWVIATSAGQPVAAVSVEPSGNSVILGTTPHTTGATYTLTIPQGVMSINTGASYPAPTDQDYVGNGAGPGITRATSLDARTLQIIFNEPVLKGDAINPGNYTVNGNVQVLGSSYVTDSTYVLATSRQTAGHVYTVVANVRDLAGNT